MSKPFKPNLTFLQKVDDRQVRTTFSYSARSGGQYGFRGGKATYERHRAAGYVNHAPVASLGRPGIVTLTALGKQALSARSNRGEEDNG